MIPKTMNNNITDSGTPNIHIIIIRVIACSSLRCERFDVAGKSSMCLQSVNVQQHPCHEFMKLKIIHIHWLTKQSLEFKQGRNPRSGKHYKAAL